MMCSLKCANICFTQLRIQSKTMGVGSKDS
jgi:hypothetical protein